MFSIVVLVTLVVGVLVMSGDPASGSYRGKNGRITFATDSGDSPQVIMTMKRDGTDMRRSSLTRWLRTGRLMGHDCIRP